MVKDEFMWAMKYFLSDNKKIFDQIAYQLN